jgi:glycosyltransferase involved in cell wall biosynthesis
MCYFSIVIPCYNRAETVHSTIKSVQEQSFSDWECIIIDDGSSDGTRDEVEKIAVLDSRVKYFYQENGERSRARNNGFSKSKGKYICFLDSDDFFEKDHLKIVHGEIAIKNEPVALFFTNSIELHGEKIIEQDFPTYDNTKAKYLLVNSLIPARVIVHHEILKTEKFDPDIVIVEDAVLWARISMKFPVFHIESNTVIYAIHEGNSINGNNYSGRKRLNGLKTFEKRYPQIIKNLPSGFFKDLMSDCYFRIARDHISTGEHWTSIWSLLTSVLKSPLHAQTKHKFYLMIKEFQKTLRK